RVSHSCHSRRHRIDSAGGPANDQRRLKPTAAMQSALKRTGAGIPTRFNGFPIAATAADTELIRRAGMLARTAARLEALAGQRTTSAG
ncbi:MAG: hypothetical protein KJZ86_24340, partial [Caldilineaceae bacterium]|nr:hypothetical protein [Caldilineaceae bacterium]